MGGDRRSGAPRPARGIGVTLVTQRAAVLNKDVLTQAEVLIALHTIAPQDRDAIDAWIWVHGTPEQREELMASLPSLPIGTAWVRRSGCARRPRSSAPQCPGPCCRPSPR